MPPKASLPLLLAALSVVSGCARSGPRSPPPPGDGHLTLVVGGAARQLKLEGKELYGPHTNVSFFDDGYRGVYDERFVVDLRASGPHKIIGSISGQPTELYINEVPAGLRVHGLYRGRVSSFFVTRGRLQGLVGDCTYTLQAAQDEAPNTYFGGSACGGWGGGTRLTLPAGFASRSVNERVVALTLLLGSD